MPPPLASLSLDLDNKWSYLKTHGDPGWESYPTYLDRVVPRILSCCRERELTITVFVVGKDAEDPRNAEALAAVASAGHEIGNHSFGHEPWLHLYTPSELEEEIERAEQSIAEATGRQPVGFRGPGFSVSKDVLRVLIRRGYAYDASTFPTFLGPLARCYYFLTAHLTAEERRQRRALFGRFREGFRPLRPYLWQLPEGQLLEVPVTTMPLVRTPMHVSYLLYLAQFSPRLAKAYFRLALFACRWRKITPSLLLHPLDFLGGDEEPDLDFFPAMKMQSEQKVAFVGEIIDAFCEHYDVGPVHRHAELVRQPSEDRAPQASPIEPQPFSTEHPAPAGAAKTSGNGSLDTTPNKDSPRGRTASA